MSDCDKKRITENVLKYNRSSKRNSKSLLIGMSAAALCIITVSTFVVLERRNTNSNIVQNDMLTEVSNTSENKTSPEMKAEGYDGATESYLPENSGGIGYDTSTSDEEAQKPEENNNEQESKAADHNTNLNGDASAVQDDQTVVQKWNGIYCDPWLYKELASWNGTEQAFSVAVTMTGYDEDEMKHFIYEGKTIDNYLKDIEHYSSCLDDLQIIKQYALGNGTPLSVVEEIDETFRAKYLINDQYDIRVIDNDIEEYRVMVKDSTFAYDEAYSAFKNEKLSSVSYELSKVGINAQLKNDGLLYFISGAEQLSKVSLTDSVNYRFVFDYDDTEDSNIVYERGENYEAAEDENQKIYKGC